MEPILIYFKEIMLNENNRFKLEFSQTNQIYKVHFSPRKDYFITSINCDLNLVQDIKNDGKLDGIKELSEKSRLLLEKDLHIKMILRLYTCDEVFYGQQWRKYLLFFCCPQQIKIAGTTNFTTLKKKNKGLQNISSLRSIHEQKPHIYK